MRGSRESLRRHAFRPMFFAAANVLLVVSRTGGVEVVNTFFWKREEMRERVAKKRHFWGERCVVILSLALSSARGGNPFHPFGRSFWTTKSRSSCSAVTLITCSGGKNVVSVPSRSSWTRRTRARHRLDCGEGLNNGENGELAWNAAGAA